MGGAANEASHLMAGRAIDRRSKVRYGITVRRPQKDEIRTGDTRGFASRGRPPRDRQPRGQPSRGVQARLRKLHAAVGDLVRDGRTEEAERLLQKALELFDKR